MGGSQSAEAVEDDEEQLEDDDEEEEEEEDDDNEEEEDERGRELGLGDSSYAKKVLEQEPEMLPCHASASPLSPQLSSLGTPRLGPSIKVWDPYNVLAPPPPPPPQLQHPPQLLRGLSSNLMDDDHTVTEVYLICHGECHMNLRPDLVAGRCPDAALTPSGKRQARALAVFLKSQRIQFSAVYASPLDRARTTAVLVCQELSFAEEQIQSSDAVVEMSMGHWEGCHRSEIYTPEMLSLIDRFQPDFAAPSGESLRQVEFRMVQFLTTVVGLPEKLRLDFSSPPNETQGFSSSAAHDADGTSIPQPQWDLLHRKPQGLHRKKSGKSRLQIMTTTGDHEADDEMSPRESNKQSNNNNNNNNSSLREINVRVSSPHVSTIGVFTHSAPIKCLVTALLGCSPGTSQKICVDESSMTVLQHSWKTGWQIKRMNDASHLRLL